MLAKMVRRVLRWLMVGAEAKSLNYGINYGIVPNVGEGGVGRMLRSDAEAADYLKEVNDLPFLRGVQGEGRKQMYCLFGDY